MSVTDMNCNESLLIRGKTVNRINMSDYQEVGIERLRLLASKSKRNKTVRVVSKINQTSEEITSNRLLLESCHNDWMQLAPLRENHNRFIRYMNGRQWDDYVEDPDNPGNLIQEKALISRTGITPLTNNIIQQYVRNVLGQMLSNKYQTIVNARRDEDSEVAEMLTNAVQACNDANESTTTDINHIINLLSDGIAWSKITYTAWDERNETDGRIDFVNQNRIAWNQDCEDPRLFDLRRICELHSYTMQELICNFATTADDEIVLRRIYSNIDSSRQIREINNEKASTVLHTLDFYGWGSEQNKCRVIEVWQKLGRWVMWVHDRATTERPREYVRDFDSVITNVTVENTRRLTQALSAGLQEEDIADSLIEYEKHYEEYWHVKFLTPTGECLLEMESPYDHQQHPYVFSAMPIVDGAPKALLSDIIEMQRNINRQRTMVDILIAGSAKNTLFIPEECLDGRDIKEYADEIVKINGVIAYKAKPGIPQPEFMSRNATNIGVWDLLNFDMMQAKEISGLSGALQGQTAASNTPASLYMQQAQNAMLNFVLLFDRFNNYCTKRDDKLLKVLVQYYNRPRHIAISGRAYASAATEYIPEKARAIVNNYSLVSSQSTDTPVFRQRIDDFLMDLVKMGLPLDIFLEYTTLPFGKKLLSQMKALQEQVQNNGQLDANLINSIQEQAAENSSPEAMQMLQKILGGKAKVNPAGQVA